MNTSQNEINFNNKLKTAVGNIFSQEEENEAPVFHPFNGECWTLSGSVSGVRYISRGIGKSAGTRNTAIADSYSEKDLEDIEQAIEDFLAEADTKDTISAKFIATKAIEDTDCTVFTEEEVDLEDVAFNGDGYITDIASDFADSMCPIYYNDIYDAFRKCNYDLSDLGYTPDNVNDIMTACICMQLSEEIGTVLNDFVATIKNYCDEYEVEYDEFFNLKD